MVQIERRRRRLLLTCVITLLSVAAGLLVYGWWTKKVLPTRAPVALVTTTSGHTLEISRAEFQARVRFERARYREQAKRDPEVGNQLADVSGFGLMTLERMTREALVREKATQQELTVSAEEIDRYIELTYAAMQLTPSPTTSTEAAFEKKYAHDLQEWARYGVNEQEFREIVQAQLLEDKLCEYLGEEAFQAWLDEQQARVTLLDRWREDVPSEPAWP